jgi:chromosome partitioning protein
VSRFIAIANQKGGVGKTTTTVNLAASLASFGQRVLVLDMDPQGNASSGLGVAANALHRGVYEVLMGSMPVQEAVWAQASPGVDLLPSGQRLIGAEVELVSALARERILEKNIQPIKDNYDILLADCPPSLGLLTVNTLTAADTVLIPMQCEYYALEGLTQLLNTIKLIQHALNPRLEIEGILLTMFDARLNLSREVAEEARKFFPGRVYETAIPRNVRLSEAPSFGKPVLQYDPECSGAQFYLKLAREVLKLPEDMVLEVPVVAVEPTTELEHATDESDPAPVVVLQEGAVALPGETVSLPAGIAIIETGFSEEIVAAEDAGREIASSRESVAIDNHCDPVITPEENCYCEPAVGPVPLPEEAICLPTEVHDLPEPIVTLSAADLAEDVVTLSEDSIVPAGNDASAPRPISGLTAYDEAISNYEAARLGEPLTLPETTTTPPRLEEQAASPETETTGDGLTSQGLEEPLAPPPTVLEPMARYETTAQEAHPQEELVSHD